MSAPDANQDTNGDRPSPSRQSSTASNNGQNNMDVDRQSRERSQSQPQTQNPSVGQKRPAEDEPEREEERSEVSGGGLLNGGLLGKNGPGGLLNGVTGAVNDTTDMVLPPGKHQMSKDIALNPLQKRRKFGEPSFVDGAAVDSRSEEQKRLDDVGKDHKGDSGSLRIRIELDLDVEVHLSARVKGDITIGLL